MSAPDFLPATARTFAAGVRLTDETTGRSMLAADIVDGLITRAFTDTVRGCGPTCVVPDAPLTPLHLAECPCPHEGDEYLEARNYGDIVVVCCSDCGATRDRKPTNDEISDAAEAQYAARDGAGYASDSRDEHDETL